MNVEINGLKNMIDIFKNDDIFWVVKILDRFGNEVILVLFVFVKFFGNFVKGVGLLFKKN